MNKAISVIMDNKFANHYKSLKQVFLSITNSCNQNCIYCLYKPWIRNGEDINIEIAIALLKKFKNLGANKLSLLGGEPTLYGKKRKENDLFKLINNSVRLGYTYIRLVTNGNFEKEILSNDQFKLLNEISFSIDGPSAEFNDKYRGTGSFKKTVKNMKQAISLGYKVDVTICVHKDNFHYNEFGKSILEKQFDWAYKLGVQRVNLHPIFKMGIPRDRWTGDTDIEVSQWIKLYKKITNDIRKNEYKIPIRIPQRFVTPKQFDKNRLFYGYCPVKAGERVEVHPNGLIQTCALLKGTSVCTAKYHFNGKDIKIKWETENNELSTYNFNFNDEHPCAVMQKKFKNYLPLCISFKPEQDEIVWKDLGIDRKNIQKRKLDNKIKSNEEEIKIKYVIPALNSLGWETMESMEFEQSISSSNQSAKKRADIIIEIDKKLLLIETKASTVNIKKDKWINQVIMYCTLIEPHIPHAIITNGSDAIIVDSKNKNMYDSKTNIKPFDNIINQFINALNDQRSLIFQVLNHEKIKQFTDNQIKNEIVLLKGDIADTEIKYRKYIPEVYIQCKALEDCFQKFLISTKMVFSLLGEAGRGKTNFLSRMAETLYKNELVLFFSGITLSNGIKSKVYNSLKRVKKSNTFDDLMYKLLRYLKNHNRMLYIFIDGINECPLNIEILRDELNEICKDFINSPLKLIVSCRSPNWLLWYDSNGEYKGYFSKSVFSLENEKQSYIIRRFNDNEFDSAWLKYKKVFKLKGIPSDNIKLICREQFILRLFAEKYKNGKKFPDHIESIELFEYYIVEKFPSIERRIEVRKFLFWMSKKILDNEIAYVNYNDVPDNLLNIRKILIDENVITSYNDYKYISFNFELFLEYIISEFIFDSFLQNHLPFGDRREKILSLVGSKLVNMPLILINILLKMKDNKNEILSILSDLVLYGEKWEKACCTLLKKITKYTKDFDDIIMILASSPNYINRIYLSESLSNYIKKMGWDLIFHLARNDDWKLKETALNVINNEEKFNDKISSLLIELMNDDHWRVRRALGYVFQKYWGKNQGPLKYIISKYKSLTWKEKYSLIVSFADVTVFNDDKIIKTFSKDNNPQLRWAIAHYLPRFKDIDHQQIIWILKKDKNDWVRSKLAESILILFSKFRDLKYKEVLVDIVKHDQSPSVRIKIARNIEIIKTIDTELFKFILDILCSDENPDVYFAAQYALNIEVSYEQFIKKSTSKIYNEKNMIFFYFREKITRSEILPLKDIKEYIKQRTKFQGRNDPYMEIIIDISSLIDKVVFDLGMKERNLYDFLIFISNDTDEGIRWALVCYLTHLGKDLIEFKDVLKIFKHLVLDSHWWIRREIASALGHIEWDDSTKEGAKELLWKIKNNEKQTANPCYDEVMFFVNKSLNKS